MKSMKRDCLHRSQQHYRWGGLLFLLFSLILTGCSVRNQGQATPSTSLSQSVGPNQSNANSPSGPFGCLGEATIVPAPGTAKVTKAEAEANARSVYQSKEGEEKLRELVDAQYVIFTESNEQTSKAPNGYKPLRNLEVWLLAFRWDPPIGYRQTPPGFEYRNYILIDAQIDAQTGNPLSGCGGLVPSQP